MEAFYCLNYRFRVYHCLLWFLLIAGGAANYQIGTTYHYQYETSVIINEANGKKSASSEENIDLFIKANLDIIPLYQLGTLKFIKLQILKVDAVYKNLENKNLNRVSKFPIFFEIHENGEVSNIYLASEDSIFSTNFKKGVINLFQLKNSEQTAIELDVSGECSVSYSHMGTRIIKMKENCTNLEIAGDFAGPKKLFGASVSSSAVITYIMKKDIIDTAVGNSLSVIHMNLNNNMNIEVNSMQKLKLESQSQTNEKMVIPDLDKVEAYLDKKLGYGHTVSLLPSVGEVQHCTKDCRSPIEIMQKHKETLGSSNLSKLPSASAFLEIVRAFRNSGKDLIIETMTHQDSYYIVSQLIDVASAAQTQDTHRSIMELLNFEEEHIDYPERYLFTLAFATKPEEFIIKDLLVFYNKKLKSSKLQESIGLTLGALMFTYCLVPSQCQEQIVQQYIKSTINQLAKCKKNDACKLMYLRSMGNAGLKEFLPVLLTHSVYTKSSTISCTAIYSLRRFNKDIISDKAVPVMVKIFKQTTHKYDSSTRLAAMEVLIRINPCPLLLEELLTSIKTEKNHEFTNYVLSRIRDMANNDPTFRKAMKLVFEKPHFLSYKLLSGKGTSSAFTSFLTASNSVNTTYGLYIENSKASVMKRSFLEIEAFGNQGLEKVLTFGLYADGIEGLVSEELADGEEIEPTAGMSLTLFDVLLRPIEFFRGSGELMSAAWNAPSEPTSALQGNILLQDDHKTLHLFNGFVVNVDLMTAMSMDISGSMVNSLWSRTSDSVLTNSGALLFEGSVKLDSDKINAGIEFRAGGEGYVDFKTNVDFAEMPVKSCMRMVRPEITFMHNITKFETVPRKEYRSKIFRTYKIPPVSYYLNRHSSLQCNRMIDSIEV